MTDGLSTDTPPNSRAISLTSLATIDKHCHPKIPFLSKSLMKPIKGGSTHDFIKRRNFCDSAISDSMHRITRLRCNIGIPNSDINSDSSMSAINRISNDCIVTNRSIYCGIPHSSPTNHRICRHTHTHKHTQIRVSKAINAVSIIHKNKPVWMQSHSDLMRVHCSKNEDNAYIRSHQTYVAIYKLCF